MCIEAKNKVTILNKENDFHSYHISEYVTLDKYSSVILVIFLPFVEKPSSKFKVCLSLFVSLNHLITINCYQFLNLLAKTHNRQRLICKRNLMAYVVWLYAISILFCDNKMQCYLHEIVLRNSICKQF